MENTKPLKVLSGQRFGRWIVLDDFVLTTKGERKWLCRCDCGAQRYVLERGLVYGGSESCGCLRKEKAAAAISPDLTGQVFGELTVLRRAVNPKTRGVVWVCKCSCGAEYEVQGTLLTNGRRTRCPSKVHRKNYAYSDVTGKNFEMLTALYPIWDQRDSRSVIWHCRCECGNEIDVPYNNLVYGNMKSCGCKKKAHDKKLGSFLTHVAGTSLDMLKSQKVPTNNTTGVKGVYLINGKWVAKIVFQKKQYYLGTFSDFATAAQVRKEAEEMIRDGTVSHYSKWKAKADVDPEWARKNPISIHVEKKQDNTISISLLPVMN